MVIITKNIDWRVSKPHIYIYVYIYIYGGFQLVMGVPQELAGWSLSCEIPHDIPWLWKASKKNINLKPHWFIPLPYVWWFLRKNDMNIYISTRKYPWNKCNHQPILGVPIANAAACVSRSHRAKLSSRGHGGKNSWPKDCKYKPANNNE